MFGPTAHVGNLETVIPLAEEIDSDCCRKITGLELTSAESELFRSEYRSATCKAAEDDCLERRNSIRPRVPSRVAYKAERGGNEPFWSPWTMYPRSQERHRNREATVYLPALGGDGPRLDRTTAN
jgi:hypothetical protein